VNGWTFAGWAFAAIATLVLLSKVRAYQEAEVSGRAEREALWEQLRDWRPIVEEYAMEREKRDRLAVTN